MRHRGVTPTADGRAPAGLPFRPDAVLLDMDGTLVDSDAAVERAWTTWAVEHGVDGDAVLAIAHGSPPEPTVRRMLPALDAEAVAVAAARQMSLQYDDLTDVAVAGAVARERAVHFALARAMLPPEVHGKHRRGKDDEPDHGCSKKQQWQQCAAYRRCLRETMSDITQPTRCVSLT